MKADEFIERVLVAGLACRTVIGYDFTSAISAAVIPS
jgi:FAD synthase